MLIKAIAPWFGSKRNLAPEIVAEMGPHRKYDEPFCGSLAILLAKEIATQESANDLHGELINLARVLQLEATAVELYRRLTRFLLHEDLHREAAERHKTRGHKPAGESIDIDRATDFMICSWFGRNGVAGTQSYNQGFCMRYTKNGGHAATRWVSAVESIPDWHMRLRAVTMTNRDGLEILERLEDAAGCVIYCDPPYFKKGAKYIHDFESADHDKLAELLSRFRKTRVLLSYYDDPRLDALYQTWTRRDLKATKALVNQGARNSSDGPVAAPEVLLINGPSLKESGRLF
jgi:DNA adenine methylase